MCKVNRILRLANIKSSLLRALYGETATILTSGCEYYGEGFIFSQIILRMDAVSEPVG